MTSPLRDAESATAGVPVVRGLDWADYGDEAEWYSDDGPDDAEGLYWVKSSNINPGEWDLLVLRQRLDSFRSPDEAKAAAQADYEQRIKSALNPDFLSELDTARAEIDRLRQIVANCGAALPSGAFVSADASLEFMAILPDEITACCARIQAGADEANEKLARVILALPSGYGEGERGKGPVEGVLGLRNRFDRAESALTAAQARIAELERGIGVLLETIGDFARPPGDQFYTEVVASLRTLSPVKENDRG